MFINTKTIVRAGVIAGLYVVLSLVVFPLASGVVQLRISEGLTLLPIIFIEAIPALFVGCLVCNLITGCAMFDVVLGSLITLVAAILTRCATKKITKISLKILVGGFFPTLLNAIFLPLIWLIYGVGEYLYYVQVLILLLSQSLSVYLIGGVTLLGVMKIQQKLTI